MRHRPTPATLLLVAASVSLAAAPARAGFMDAQATVTGPQEVTFTWSWYEFDGYITDRPEWVGYDVMRRPVNECTSFVRLNADIVPRVYGQNHSHTLVDATPAMAQTWEYRAVPVDANHQPVVMLFPDCEPPCVKPAWGTTPPGSSPLAIGTLNDWGWAMAVAPCPGSCYSHFYFGGEVADELRALGLEGSIVRLFGAGWCCGVEGASMTATAWETAECVSTPVRRSSWGELKTRYR